MRHITSFFVVFIIAMACSKEQTVEEVNNGSEDAQFIWEQVEMPQELANNWADLLLLELTDDGDYYFRSRTHGVAVSKVLRINLEDNTQEVLEHPTSVFQDSWHETGILFDIGDRVYNISGPSYLDKNSNTWVAIETDEITKRQLSYQSYPVLFDDHIYVPGGVEFQNLSNRMLVYSIQNESWLEPIEMPVGLISGLSIIHDNQIFIFPNGLTLYHLDTEIQYLIYDITSNSWEEVSGSLPEDVRSASVKMDGQYYLALNGGIYEFNPSERTFEKYASFPQTNDFVDEYFYYTNPNNLHLREGEFYITGTKNRINTSWLAPDEQYFLKLVQN